MDRAHCATDGGDFLGTSFSASPTNSASIDVVRSIPDRSRFDLARPRTRLTEQVNAMFADAARRSRTASAQRRNAEESPRTVGRIPGSMWAA